MTGTATLGQRVQGAAKWSLLTELLARIVTPVTQLILARLLAPEAFGVVATVVMVTSFAQMLADSGFQNYLIQREFSNDEALRMSANVAFWSSMAVALGLLGVITVFRDAIADLVGNPGLGWALVVASFSLPVTVCVSTQLALFRRSFEYKKLLPVRVGASLAILVVSVLLAMAGFDYWSIIIGTLCGALLNAVALTVMSAWKPSLEYSFDLLREMFAFSGWSLLEAITIWMTTWAGVFIVGSLLTAHELGLYRQPITVINSLFALVVSATTPILFSALSRLQADRDGFRRFFLKFQFAVAMIVLPLGIGAFFYREFLVSALFGSQWADAALMFGLWGGSTGFMIVFAHYCSEVYRALGKPRISMLVQVLYMAVLVPALYLAARHGFETLVIVSAAVRVVSIAINQVTTHRVAGIGFAQVVRNIYAPLVAVTVMGGAAAWWTTAVESTWAWSIAGILVCCAVYAAACLCFAPSRRFLLRPLSARG